MTPPAAAAPSCICIMSWMWSVLSLPEMFLSSLFSFSSCVLCKIAFSNIWLLNSLPMMLCTLPLSSRSSLDFLIKSVLEADTAVRTAFFVSPGKPFLDFAGDLHSIPHNRIRLWNINTTLQVCLNSVIRVHKQGDISLTIWWFIQQMFAVLGVLGVWSLWSCVEKAMTVFIMRKKEEQDSKQVHPPYPKVQDNPLQL